MLVAVPKKVKIDDQDYIDWIRSLRCCVTGRKSIDPNTGLECSDPHHVNKKGHGTMGGKCDDSRAIPLSHALHDEVHRIGNFSFAKKYSLDYELIIETLNQLYPGELKT